MKKMAKFAFIILVLLAISGCASCQDDAAKGFAYGDVEIPTNARAAQKNQGNDADDSCRDGVGSSNNYKVNDNDNVASQLDEVLVITDTIPKKQLPPFAEEYYDYVLSGNIRFCISITELMWHSGGSANEDIEFLRYLVDLTFLTLSMGTDLGVIDITQGEHFDFPEIDLNTRITDISVLEGLTSLEYLSLDGNHILDISPLANLTELTTLRLTGNAISDITPLAALTNLTYLTLGGNPISDLSPLANLVNLEMLQLCGFVTMETFSLEPLRYLTNLTHLSIRGRQLTDDDIVFLSGLTNLQALDLRSNQITNLTPLTNLTNLTTLGLHYNPITDWSPVEHIGRVGGRP